MSAATTSPIQRTQEFFRTKFGRELTGEEARDANERISTVFLLLDKWNRANPVPACAALSPDAGVQRKTA
jgi:hypothetical protein